jgi:hypothetical protein
LQLNKKKFMKEVVFTIALVSGLSIAFTASAQVSKNSSKSHSDSFLFIDVHNMPAGKVRFAEVADAHKKDLAVQGKHGVNFLKYWVDEKNSRIYCLAETKDSNAIRKAHGEAHGLLPDHIHAVSSGDEAVPVNGRSYFLDIHEFGPGNVSAAAVAGAHEQDLAQQAKFGVNFINYWIDEKAGVVMCLSQAPDAKSVHETHKHAHGLVPTSIMEVQQGE